MIDSGAVYLPNTDADYLAWCQMHPLGYVINAREPGMRSMVWHRVGCWHIRPDGVKPFVGGEYLKVCALDPGELAVWAKGRNESLYSCADCRIKGTSDR